MIDLVRGAGGGPRVGSRSGVELETFPASIGPCANLAVTRLLDYGDGEFSDVDLFAGGPQLEHQRLNSNGGALGGLVCDAGDCGQQLDVYGRAQTTCMSPSSKLTPAPTTVGGAVSHGATSLTTLIACSRAAVQCAEPNVAKSSRLKYRSGDHQVYSHAIPAVVWIEVRSASDIHREPMASIRLDLLKEAKPQASGVVANFVDVHLPPHVELLGIATQFHHPNRLPDQHSHGNQDENAASHRRLIEAPPRVRLAQATRRAAAALRGGPCRDRSRGLDP